MCGLPTSSSRRYPLSQVTLGVQVLLSNKKSGFSQLGCCVGPELFFYTVIVFSLVISALQPNSTQLPHTVASAQGTDISSIIFITAWPREQFVC
jgi:hypothetical protein